MSRESYQQLLDELREHVVEMGELVVERLKRRSRAPNRRPGDGRSRTTATTNSHECI